VSAPEPLLTRESSIRVDREGRFWHEGERVDHEGLARGFAQWISWDRTHARHVLRNAMDWCWVHVDDAPLVVWAASVRDDGEVTLTLSDGTREPLDVGSLRIDRDDVPYCDVRGGTLEARFLPAAAFALLERAEPDGEGWALPLGPTRISLRRVERGATRASGMRSAGTSAGGDRAPWWAEAEAIARGRHPSVHERAEASERVREGLDDEDEGGLFDLALLEARAHAASLDGPPGTPRIKLDDDASDVLLGAWSRVLAAPPPEGRDLEARGAVAALCEALESPSIRGSSESRAAAWSALARGALRADEPLWRGRALDAFARCCDGSEGALRAQCALLALELAGAPEHEAHAARATDWLEALARDAHAPADERAAYLEPVWQARLMLGDTERAGEAARTLLALVRAMGRPERVADALLATAECAMAVGRREDAESALTERLEIAERVALAHPEDLFARARADEARETLALARCAAEPAGTDG
jgi:hypothetical protein